MDAFNYVSVIIRLGLSAILKNERYHAAVAILLGLLFFTFIFLFGARLGGM